MNVSRRPLPVLAIETLGYLGVGLWLVLILRAWTSTPFAAWWVTIVGLVLGAAHVLISVGATRRARVVLPAMWFVLAADILLTLVVDVRALILVGASILLLLLMRTSSARAWWKATPVTSR